MPIWIPHTQHTSDSVRAQARTAWLHPLAADVDAILQASYAAEPETEEYTLDVLAGLDPARVSALAGERSPGRIKQDIGIFVTQRLDAVFGEARVETLRRSDGRSAASRRNPRPELDVHSFAPHRVRPKGGADLGAAAPTVVDSGADPSDLPKDFAGAAGWGELFDAWREALAAYIDDATDLPWWYNEAANVSALAGAVWRAGGVCISEYQVDRGRPNLGRADLWLRLGVLRGDLEAKISWPKHIRFAEASVPWELEQAALQLRSVSVQERAKQRFAACFVVPALVKPVNPQGQARAIFKAALEQARRESDSPHAMVSFTSDHPMAQVASSDGYVYPGVALILRQVRP